MKKHFQPRYWTHIGLCWLSAAYVLASDNFSFPNCIIETIYYPVYSCWYCKPEGIPWHTWLIRSQSERSLSRRHRQAHTKIKGLTIIVLAMLVSTQNSHLAASLIHSNSRGHYATAWARLGHLKVKDFELLTIWLLAVCDFQEEESRARPVTTESYLLSVCRFLALVMSWTNSWNKLVGIIEERRGLSFLWASFSHLTSKRTGAGGNWQGKADNGVRRGAKLQLKSKLTLIIYAIHLFKDRGGWTSVNNYCETSKAVNLKLVMDSSVRLYWWRLDLRRAIQRALLCDPHYCDLNSTSFCSKWLQATIQFATTL